jgi:hypothetical protein
MFEFYLWALLLSRKRFLLGAVLSVLLCASSVLSVKADATTWAQTYDKDMSLDWAFSLVETADGGYAIAGYTNSSGADYDFWLVKTDGVGNVEWNQTYGGPAVDIPGTLVVTSDGGYAIAGTTDSFGAGNTDFWLVKTDAAGNMEWNKTYGGADYDAASSLIVTSDGGYAIAGYTRSFGAGDRDFWLVKTDAAGNMEWNQTYGGANSEEAGSLVVTSDGGYAIAGAWDVVYDIDPVHGFSISNGDFWLVKTDAFGNMEWNQTYGGAWSDRAGSLVVTSDGGYALAGITNSSGIEDGDFWLVKTDAFGNMEWNRTYGGTDYDCAESLIATSDGGYALAGFTSSFGVGGGDFWLIKTDENGVAPVVPEASWVILPLLLTATLSILISKKKLLHPRS